MLKVRSGRPRRVFRAVVIVVRRPRAMTGTIVSTYYLRGPSGAPPLMIRPRRAVGSLPSSKAAVVSAAAPLARLPALEFARDTCASLSRATTDSSCDVSLSVTLLARLACPPPMTRSACRTTERAAPFRCVLKDLRFSLTVPAWVNELVLRPVGGGDGDGEERMAWRGT